MKRKGSALDIIALCAIILALGIVIVVGTHIKDNILPEFQEALGGTAAQGIIDEVDVAFNVLDYVFIAVVVGMGAAAIVTAFMIPTHPVFFFISILLLMVALLLAPTFSNVFRTLTDDAEFSTIVDSYSMMKLVFENLPLFILMFGMLVMVATYAKMTRGDEI